MSDNESSSSEESEYESSSDESIDLQKAKRKEYYQKNKEKIYQQQRIYQKSSIVAKEALKKAKATYFQNKI